MMGGFELGKSRRICRYEIGCVSAGASLDQFARLTVEVEPTEPHLITKIDTQRIPRPADFPLPHRKESDLIGGLQTKVEQDTAADRFAGAVLLAKAGKPIFERAYGLADREGKIQNSLKTRFRIGSMNKMFTATAVLQLAQANKLGIDDPLGKCLTDHPNEEIATKVTIKQLLTHTGGTGDIFGPEFDAHRRELRTLQDYVTLYGARGPKFEPGSRWEYSNYGFILLGLVIEKASGEIYYDYVRMHVYEPAGMTSTGSEPEDQAVPDRSVGYTKMGGNGQWRPNADTLPYRAGPRREVVTPRSKIF